jgi:N-alpha-acetyltransferase 35, NatC auxiliary subunit
VSSAEVRALLDEGLSYLAKASITPDMKNAIKKRLLFRQSILKTLEEDMGPLSARSKSSLACVPLLRDIKDTRHLGRCVNEAFSTKIQRSLASSVPPRPMVNIEFLDALSHFDTLCNDNADVDQILDTKTSEDLFTAILVFMSRKPQPSVYIRALVQSFLLEPETHRILGKSTPKEFLFCSLAALVLPNSPILDRENDLVEAPTNPRFQMAQLLAEFDGKVGHQFLNVFRNSCLNRCRTRRTLCHLVLDWDTLQADAEDLDGTLRTYTEEKPALYASDQPTFSYPLSSWIYHHKLNHLRHIIQMGFELTVYAPDEIAGMYWYLSYICGTHLSHLDRISFFLQRDMQNQDSFPQDSAKASKSALERQAAFQGTLEKLFRAYTHLKATDALARALHALHTLLLRHRAIGKPPRPYSSEKLRYELRMRPFLTLNIPEPVTFEAFEGESSFAGLSDDEVLEEALVRVKDAKRLWEEVLKARWSAELAGTREMNQSSKSAKVEANKGSTTIEDEWSKAVKNVIRACIATSISTAAMKEQLDKEGELKGIKTTIPIPGEKDCWHDWWIVPVISGVTQQDSRKTLSVSPA